MKKIFSLLIALVLVVSVVAGCARNEQKTEITDPVDMINPDRTEENDQSEEYEPVDIRLGGLKGPTTMGLVKLLDESENGNSANRYEFTLGGSADELTPKLLKGELDILAAPANLASILYNNSDGAVEVIGINALGVVYIAEKGETVSSLADLAGKTIYATGKGSTPEYALGYLLSQNGMELGTDVTVEWKSEPTEVVALMAEQENAIAMLPQPYVTVASTQIDGLRIAVDLTKEWEDLDNGSDFITAALIVRREFAENHPEAVAKFLEEYAASADFVNENPSEAAQLIEKYDIVKAAIAEKAIPYCNIVCITGEEMKTTLSGYLEILATQNPKAVGENLPGADFYWVNEK